MDSWDKIFKKYISICHGSKWFGIHFTLISFLSLVKKIKAMSEFGIGLRIIYKKYKNLKCLNKRIRLIIAF